MSEHVRSALKDGVLTLRLDRPEKKNALTGAMYGALSAGLRRAAEEDAVRVVLLAGGTDFTAGNDINDFAGDTAGERAPRTSAAFDFLELLATTPKPVVAAVRGFAIGIGTTMLLHCDASVAAQDARLQMPFTRLGIVPEAGSSLALADFVGRARASWLLLSGEAMDGAAAEAAGLVTRAVPDDEVEPTAAAMALSLAAVPPGALAETKRLVREPHRAALAEAMQRERAAFAARLKTAEAQAIFAAFLAKSKGR
jgi:enoyl-CoA hydratase/carnithine racemase